MQPRPTRVAIDSPLNLAGLPPRSTYSFAVRRGRTRVTVQVTSARGSLEGAWAALCTDGLIGIIALLAVWRGRDRAAAGLTLWAAAFLTAIAISFVPSDGLWPVLVMWSFYVMAESMVTGLLHPRARASWRAGFLVLLAVTAIRALIGPIVFVTTSWAELLRPAYGLIVSATCLPHHAAPRELSVCKDGTAAAIALDACEQRIIHCRYCAKQHATYLGAQGFNQFSMVRPGTRRNSRSLFVTTVAPIWRACDAMSMS